MLVEVGKRFFEPHREVRENGRGCGKSERRCL
jgi:hypothetical protein